VLDWHGCVGEHAQVGFEPVQLFLAGDKCMLNEELSRALWTAAFASNICFPLIGGVLWRPAAKDAEGILSWEGVQRGTSGTPNDRVW
jgi:hypothetical protein